MKHQLISKKEAKAKGLKHYFMGEVCKNGRIAIRYVSNGVCTCVACRKQKAEAQRLDRKQNPEKFAARNKAYKEKNRDLVLAGQRKCYHEKRDYYREYQAQYYQKNKHLYADHGRRYKARRAERMPPWFGELDAFVIQEAYRLSRLRKKATGFGWHVDHLVPLNCKTASGLHCAANIQVIPGSVNCSKKHTMVLTEPFEWFGCIGNGK